MIKKRINKTIPTLNTASLPDLIFTVLFFFMIVTHMRQVTLKVKYKMPQGTTLTRLTKKTAVSYIHIGYPINTNIKNNNKVYIQLNDKITSAQEIEQYIKNERQKMSPEDLQKMTVSIKADENTPLAIIKQVKIALRKAKSLKINYSATNQNNISKQH